MLRRERAGSGVPAGMIALPDGSIVRGAKKGGITDHIAGPHLIPNVGREAMVPGEVVCRRHKPKSKPQPKPPPKPVAEVRKKSRREAPRMMRSESRRADRSRSRGRHRDDSEGSSSDRSRRTPRDIPDISSAVLDRPREKTKEEQEEERRLERRNLEEAEEREKRRHAEEQLKLRELEKLRSQKAEQDRARRTKLSGMFAFTEDDMNEEEDDEVQRARAAKEKQLAEERRGKRDRLALPEVGQSSSASSTSQVPVGGAKIDSAKDAVTALDIDGRGHDHKFAKVWKDWDASKKDDPGEIARQFMKVSAVNDADMVNLPIDEAEAGAAAGDVENNTRRRAVERM
eukprot:CAMPEP_0115545642 /NCGR_PEP_ID=MMETSP0271-20121206/92710_1 /TAXON_ID=71861 /ORGANISM="Scrippsiella trochoidea, Strain CCMP3099" /LENGTH=342 /DNA_ID=CAMNT_0002978997 /DNA_START=1 /DNA_END=1028 /DNA_ORIENTATION=-